MRLSGYPTGMVKIVSIWLDLGSTRDLLSDRGERPSLRDDSMVRQQPRSRDLREACLGSLLMCQPALLMPLLRQCFADIRTQLLWPCNEDRMLSRYPPGLQGQIGTAEGTSLVDWVVLGVHSLYYDTSTDGLLNPYCVSQSNNLPSWQDHHYINSVLS